MSKKETVNHEFLMPRCIAIEQILNVFSSYLKSTNQLEMALSVVTAALHDELEHLQANPNEIGAALSLKVNEEAFKIIQSFYD